MDFQRFGIWFTNWLNSDVFVDWILMLLFGVILYGLGSRNIRNFHVAGFTWATITGWEKPKKMLYVRSYVLCFMGSAIVVWSSLLALMIPDHYQRVNLYTIGILGIFAVAIAAILIIEFCS